MSERNGSGNQLKTHSAGSAGGFTITYVNLPDDVLRRVARLASQKQKTTNELIRDMVSREVEENESDESTVGSH